MAPDLIAAILAGGTGKRFWPLGRRSRPKPFLPVVEGRSLLLSTWDRIAGLCAPERILVVGLADHAAAIRRELPELPGANLLLEPVPRDTAAACALAALAARKRGSDVAVLVVPADHRIAAPEAFRAVVQAALPLARRHLVTFGLAPGGPDPAFGYLEAGDPVGEGNGLRVRRFVEKPSRQRAERLLAGGNVLWNSGIFLWSPEVYLEAVRAHLPRLGAGLGAMEAGLAAADPDRLRGVYVALDPVSVDHGILERAGNVVVVPAEFGWSDLGSWSALGSLLPEAGEGNRSEGEIAALDAHGNLVWHPEGITALIGVRDLCVVYSGGALLVCSRERTEEVKRLVEILERRHREKYL